MPCPHCGSDRFIARQRLYADVIVDSSNSVVDSIGTSDCDDPYGPYTCATCGKDFEELPRPTSGSRPHGAGAPR
jgi:DNA-directed RNA polymerase subunit RPC12/RpoP